MARYRVGFIGVGRPRGQEGFTGFGMAHMHALGYEASPDCQITAVADINLENAKAFQAMHGGERLYQDYREMLKNEHLDIVSISTWPALHAEMVVAAAKSGVKGVYCEKPMAPTYGESVRMARVCSERGVQLAFNHQRRFGEPFRKAKAMLKMGAIGQLIRLEATCPTMLDWGTHWLDMMFYYNDETPAEWVLGQVDRTGGTTVFAVPAEGQAISYIKFINGVYGLLVTGFEAGWQAQNRLVGSDGVIEVGPSREVHLRAWVKGQPEWQTIPVSEGLHRDEYVKRAVLDFVDALNTGREPELSARKALQATEVIFATFESSRRRGRVELPLLIEDSPLLSMMAVK